MRLWPLGANPRYDRRSAVYRHQKSWCLGSRRMLQLAQVAVLTLLAAQESPLVTPMSVCDAIAASESLRGRLVAIRGHVVSGFEVFVLASDDCRADSGGDARIWLEEPKAGEPSYAEVAFPEFLRAASDKSV